MTAARRYFSVIVGEGCNAACPFCIAPEAVKHASEPLPAEQVRAAATFALAQGARVASVSGGGEPMLLARRDRPAWDAVIAALSPFAKRDLHSNFAFDPRVPLVPAFTHLTVSLWPSREITRRYMGRDHHDRVLRLLGRRDPELRLRLSATVGRDWCRSLDDVHAYVKLARQVGAEQVTLRELQEPVEGSDGWVADHHLPGAAVQEWLGARYPQSARTVRDAAVFAVEGVDVCVYRYARDLGVADEEFLYFRPSASSGRYGLYTDYDDDRSQLDPSVWTPSPSVAAQS